MTDNIEKSIEENTQKAIDEANAKLPPDAKPKEVFETVEAMKKDFKESQKADLEENFEEGL
jgi:hypothetical protein